MGASTSVASAARFAVHRGCFVRGMSSPRCLGCGDSEERIGVGSGKPVTRERIIMRMPSYWCVRWLWVACLFVPFLPACGASSSALHTDFPEEVSSDVECEAPDADQCVVFACEGALAECGLFACDDVDPALSASARRELGVRNVSHPYRPVRPPGRLPPRDYRRSGIRQAARPRMVFHFGYRYGYLPAFPPQDGSRLVKHHLFPQEELLARWFARHGINIHEFTMVVPEHLHLRVHNPGGRGGPWNAAWREYMNANLHRRRIPKEELLRKSLELAFRFDIAGPIVPYYGHPIPPPGPQLFADP
ncbi:SitA6 family polymorphic toxin lipoprotein [Myxococcus faecalis]|uniref:SitA6 family polymorphic toxin lipoprotein n=1 Tax=Myxococcus faecalis TaxID=3115646 RepID=UPI003CF1CC39